jgi:hypothetical protein
MFAKSKTKGSHNPWGSDSPEKLKDTNENLLGFKQQVKTLVNPTGMLDMIFGTPKSTGENISANKDRKQAPRTNETLIFSRVMSEKQSELHKETSIILNQLKEQVTLLERSEKAFSKEISKIKVEQMPAKTGIYYLRYFEWLITIVRQLRVKVDEGKAWLQTFNTKKCKKMGYWQKYKKHGTTFGLSNERSLSTQTG